MDINIMKVVFATIIAVACIVAMIIDSDNVVWALPIVTAVVGYVIGNSKVTSQTGATSPIIKTTGD